MEPSVWGPPCWFFLHTISFYYPEKPSFKDKNNYYNFFINLENIIPCEICRNHYKKNLKEFPITPYLDSKKSLIQWVVNLHNLVNKDNGKPEWSAQEVTNLYKKIYSEKKQFCYYFQNDVNDHKQKSIIENNKKEVNKLNKKIYLLFIFLLFLIVILIILIILILTKKSNYDILL